jgi:hypothetical protein
MDGKLTGQSKGGWKGFSVSTSAHLNLADKMDPNPAKRRRIHPPSTAKEESTKSTEIPQTEGRAAKVVFPHSAFVILD